MATAESDPPKDAKAARLKYLGTLVAATAALVTAFGAYFKPQDHSVNKASYEELTKVLKEVSDQAEKNHDDIVALRGYVEGTLASKPAPIPVLEQDAGAAPRDAGQAVAYVQIPSKPPPPPVHSSPKPPAPPPFDTIVQQSKK